MNKTLLSHIAKTSTTIFALFIGTTCFSQLPTLQFAKKLGGTAYDYGNAITTDAGGNVYTTGVFQGTVDFNPGTGTYNLTSAGSGDVFVSKLDAAGNFVWARQMGGLLGDRGMGITTDVNGNVYVTGYYAGAVDFDPSLLGITLYTTLGDPNIFVCKLAANGNFVWAQNLGGLGFDYSYGIALDGSNNIYTVGKYQGTADFDPSLLGAANLTSNWGSEDIFVSKLDANGDYVWAKSIGASSNDAAYGLTFDASGNLVVTGYFQSTVDFDPNAGVANLVSAGGTDAFVLKMTASGNYVWAKSFGGPSSDEGNALVADLSGNIYFTGFFQATADFDPSAATSNMTSAGGTDIFLCALGSAGNLNWSRSMGGTGNDEGNAIVIESTGNIYIAGAFQGTADFDPSPSNFALTSAGGLDIFIEGFTNAGVFGWACQSGGTLDDEAISMSIFNTALHLTGYFQSTADFEPGAVVSNLLASGSFDVFVEKLDFKSLLLPVELLDFTANAEDKKVNLEWSTASESNNNFFTVERSADGSNWENIGQVNGAGNSNQVINYNHIDFNPLQGKQYYRLKQTDFDGAFTYTNPVMIKFNSTSLQVNVYPNPVVNQVNVQLNGSFTNASARIMNLQGQVIWEQENAGSHFSFDASAQQNGIYFLETTVDNETSVTKWIKN